MTTPIECPHCHKSIAVKEIRAGQSRIKCPACGELFVLIASVEGRISLKSSPGQVSPNSSRPGESPEVLAEEVAPVEVPKLLAQEFATPPVDQDDFDTIEDLRKREESLDPPFQVPRWLGGYRVGRRIGLIRVGTEFEARQLASGRDLALAVMKPRWSALPVFVARIAREVYAARHLDHPNLLLPLDFHIERGFPYVASDALRGAPLSAPEGRQAVDQKARVAAVLHVARGLKHAHEQGIYHRDITLNKIRVDGDGMTYLADLGVGLTPETPESPTAPPIALAGSPGPGPIDSTQVSFVRQDISSLGRAFQGLIGGNLGDRALSPSLASIARRMLGENPDSRFQDMGAVIRALEAELGVGGAFTPREETARAFEAESLAFSEAPLSVIRGWVALGSVAALGLFVAVALLARSPLAALGAVSLGLIALASLVALRGWRGRDPVALRVRELLLGGGLGNLTTTLATVLLVGAVLAWTGHLGLGIFLGLLGVAFGSAYHFAIDRPLGQSRLEPVDHARALIRELRQSGIAEETVRGFVARQSGPDWEEFFEQLFGYDALREARSRWGADAGGRKRPRFARWRDPIVDAIDARIDVRNRLRDRALFQAIEERALEARGINLLTARRKSRRIAEALVLFAHQYRRTRHRDEPGLPLMDALNRVAHRPDDYLTTNLESDDQPGPTVWRETLDAISRVLFGPRTRFLAGGVLLAASLIWMHQNDLIRVEEIKNLGVNAPADQQKALDDAREISRKTVEKVQGVASGSTKTKRLEVEGLSPDLTDRLDGFGLGLAGLILFASSFFRGTRFALFAVPGAVIAAVGPHLIEPGARTLGPSSLLALAVAAGLFGLGIFFGRSKE